MYRILSFFLFLFFSSASIIAQEEELNSLITQINKISDSDSLEDFLISIKWEEAIMNFDIKSTNVDLFKVNLFGDSKNEFVIQIRDGQRFVVCIYYGEGDSLKKVPGSIKYSPSDDQLTGNVNTAAKNPFLFSFDNFFNSHQNSIIVTETSNFRRGKTKYLKLFQVDSKSINLVYQSRLESNVWQHNLVDQDNLTAQYSIKLVDQYPKKIVVSGKFDLVQSRKLNSDQDILSGYKSKGEFIETVSFDSDTVNLTRVVSNVEKEIFINNLSDLDQLNNQSPIPGTISKIFYLTENFLYTYTLVDISSLEMKHHSTVGREYYLECSSVQLDEQKLTVHSKVKGETIQFQFDLKNKNN